MENWKPVVGYEGFYEVSDHGRVRTVERKVSNGLKNSGYRTVPARVLKQNQKRSGYKEVCLCKDGEIRSRKVHRLVAEAFLERTDGRECVNHKNLNKGDNRVSNLEWCSYSENSKHAIENGAFSRVIGYENRKKLVCVETGEEFPSSYQAAEWINKERFQFSKDTAAMSRKIRACAAGKQLTAYGYHWRDVK